MDPIELSIFSSRITAVCDEMGAVLRRAAFSPNIRDRLDFSCAVFDPDGALCAQAAHIPVHLGSMTYAMEDIVAGIDWQPGDMVVLNDPYLGGTHLPDVTVIAPLFLSGELCGFVANRAHHADIGSESPGSMPVSRLLEEEGVVIPPTHLVRNGEIVGEVMDGFMERMRSPTLVRGDFSAQVSANRAGLQRLEDLVAARGREAYVAALKELNDHGARLAATAIEAIPDGEYAFADVMDDDGAGNEDLPIRVLVRVDGGRVNVDFAGTAAECDGNINCPLAVTAAAVLYVFRCLMPPETPGCAGTFRDIRIHAELGTLVNATSPRAVASGNVETSSRIVDAVLGALALALPEEIPAASQGSMNNVAMGSIGPASDDAPTWDYYETLGGGMGAHSGGDGLTAVQTHMTNTLNTPIETLEMNFPLRIRRYAVRDGSGGAGRHRGGDGMIREFEFLQPAGVTLLTERRRHAPWGLNGGEDGQFGRNRLNGEDLPPKAEVRVAAGDRLSIETPGGGGWGKA